MATAALNYYRAAFREGIRGRGTGDGRRIAAPTLVLWADEDFALGSELAEGLDRYFSGRFEVRHIAGCGHWVPEEKPAVLAALIASHVSAPASAAAAPLAGATA